MGLDDGPDDGQAEPGALRVAGPVVAEPPATWAGMPSLVPFIRGRPRLPVLAGAGPKRRTPGGGPQKPTGGNPGRALRLDPTNYSSAGYPGTSWTVWVSEPVLAMNAVSPE